MQVPLGPTAEQEEDRSRDGEALRPAFCADCEAAVVERLRLWRVDQKTRRFETDASIMVSVSSESADTANPTSAFGSSPKAFLKSACRSTVSEKLPDPAGRMILVLPCAPR